jgi:hypothetical protein
VKSHPDTEVVRTGCCRAVAPGRLFAVLPCGAYGSVAVDVDEPHPFQELRMRVSGGGFVGGYRVDVGVGVLPLLPSRFRELFREE